MRNPVIRRTTVAVFFVGLLTMFSAFRVQRINAVRVKWNTQVVKISDTEAELRFTAQIPGGWHMFSQTVPDVNGPMALNFEFDASDEFQTVGQPIENGKVQPVYEPAIDMQVNSLEGQVQYTQKIKITAGKQPVIRGVINYMLSNTTEMLPPDEEELEISIN
ncbi:MAG: hypothetical protein MUC87_13250 [Bacteroidia bacterium]|jgi:thiol:disulfide interchange protein DsbD|nr:hypothetical protein [Bacteroidia bacterium]